MSWREWVADNIGYHFFGCSYNAHNQDVFDFIASKAPKKFLGKKICDLGCGDGTNTIRLRSIFRPEAITGYERNDYLIVRARQKRIKTVKYDLNQEIPKGEMASFTFALHHMYDKEGTLQKVKRNFKYVFICEPVMDLYHLLFDAGRPLSRKNWKKLFDKVFQDYLLFGYKNNIIVFYSHHVNMLA